ncbi:MAG: hypothetical protein HFF17_11215 [Oscillospiraceae bacterium]|nr:hypothetical protein [Oscillospiraceae bacterium]
MGFLDIGPGWVAMMCALYYLNPMHSFWPFCAAMACHELGHAAALALTGVPIRQLRLNLGGAVLETGEMDYRREILCALAGPLTNVCLVPLGRWFPMFATLSLCLAVFNLLPVSPLDGGRALRAWILLRRGPAAARRVMTVAAVVCGAGLAGLSIWVSAGLGGGLWPVLVAALTLLRVGLGVAEDAKKPL